jgi:hypothetical protein
LVACAPIRRKVPDLGKVSLLHRDAQFLTGKRFFYRHHHRQLRIAVPIAQLVENVAERILIEELVERSGDRVFIGIRHCDSIYHLCSSGRG